MRPASSSSERAALLGAGLLLVAGCGEGDGALDPKGEGARLISGAWWLMLGIGTAVFVFVLVVLALSLRAARRRDEALDEEGDRSMRPLIVGAGIVLPAVVIALLVSVTVWMGDTLTEASEDAVRIEIVGHQYWWDVRYPDLEVRTANEIHVPVDRPVELRFTSADVIHSFWVPQLHGKVDLVPGRTTELLLEAEEAGSYRGQCAEFCSVGHAYMHLLVVAQDAEAFGRWAEDQARPAAEPESGRLLEGRQIFLGSSCVYCHRVEGTNASSTFGPDLTHLASRRTLAAGALDNSRGELAGWILDPQRHKPGNAMPATALDPEELQLLLDYLESLE